MTPHDVHIPQTFSLQLSMMKQHFMECYFVSVTLSMNFRLVKVPTML